MIARRRRAEANRGVTDRPCPMRYHLLPALRTPALSRIVTQATLLGIPVVLLAAALGLTDETTFPLLCCCIILQSVFGIELMRSARFMAHPAPLNYLPYYFLAFGCLWVAAGRQHHWYAYFAQGVMILIPLILVAHDEMRSRSKSGRESLAPGWRPGLTARLARRAIRLSNLARAQSLSRSPGYRCVRSLELLKHPRRQIRYAALAALESHHNWEQTEVELVLRMARQDPDEELRCAAILALANVDDRQVVEELAGFMENGSCAVRETVVQSVLHQAGGTLVLDWPCRQGAHWPSRPARMKTTSMASCSCRCPRGGRRRSDRLGRGKGAPGSTSVTDSGGLLRAALDNSDENGELAVKIQRAVVSSTCRHRCHRADSRAARPTKLRTSTPHGSLPMPPVLLPFVSWQSRFSSKKGVRRNSRHPDRAGPDFESRAFFDYGTSGAKPFGGRSGTASLGAAAGLEHPRCPANGRRLMRWSRDQATAGQSPA